MLKLRVINRGGDASPTEDGAGALFPMKAQIFTAIGAIDNPELQGLLLRDLIDEARELHGTLEIGRRP